VKHLFDLEVLFSFLCSQSMDLSDYQKDQFMAYRDLLKVWSLKQNLVSTNDVSHLVERHFLPSALLARYLPESINGNLIDIGSGAGFPGVIVKIMRPEISLTLLDSSNKKVLFLEEVSEQLALKCPIICQRSEEYKPQASHKYQIVISRAVASLDLLWKWSGHLIKSGGCLYAIKGGDYQREIDGLSLNNLAVEVIVPDEDWLGISNYLNHKYIVKLEI
jgi:16S rRNA (guanine527-N7)-methyltransferase